MNLFRLNLFELIDIFLNILFVVLGTARAFLDDLALKACLAYVNFQLCMFAMYNVTCLCHNNGRCKRFRSFHKRGKENGLNN